MIAIVRRCLVFAYLAFPVGAMAQAANPAAPVAALDAGLLAAMQAGRTLPFDSRVQALLPVIERSFDLALILQNSIGPRYAGLPPTQQADLLATFTAFTAASYVANFDGFSGERFEVSPEPRPAGSDEIVQTRIVPTSGEPTRLDYVVRANGGSYKIVDVLLEGSISRVAVQRSDFRSLLSTGDAAPLIASLRSKTAGLASGNKG